MPVDIQAVKQLREETGAGMMDCKKALEDSGGDLDEARKLLREKGLAGAQKRMRRVAGEGTIGSYLHKQFGRDVVGVLVELNCETDFVAKSEEFVKLSKEIAVHVAAAKPRWIERSEVPQDVIDQEREVAEKQARDRGADDDTIKKVVEDNLNSFFEETCLLDQPYVKDDARTVGELIAELGGKVGENIKVGRFVRFAVGEGT